MILFKGGVAIVGIGEVPSENFRKGIAYKMHL